MDGPKVIFWDPNHWELHDSTMPYFEDLKSVGIFHDTLESVTCHVNFIWIDVDAWWTSPEVCEVLNRFKQSYCCLLDDFWGRVEVILSDDMTG